MIVTYEAKSYSKGRTTVMGIATLLIAWFHSCITPREGGLLWLHKQLSDIGVEMFLFASGVGVYFAWKKYKRFLPYLIGRLQRVLVPFLIVAIPWFWYHDVTIGHSRRLFLKDVMMLTFWKDGRLTFWFVAAILILYVAAPVYIHLDNRIRKKAIPLDVVAAVLIYGAMFLIPIPVLQGAIGPAMIFIPRIPVFLFGLRLGRAIEEERVYRIPLWVIVGILVICAAIVAAAMGCFPGKYPLEFKYISHGPAAVILSCMCACIPANKVCDYFGKRSLEIYLLLEKVQVTLGEYPELSPLMDFGAIPFFLLSFVLTLILVEFIRCLSCPFQKSFWQKKNDIFSVLL